MGRIDPEFYTSLVNEFLSKLGRLNKFTGHGPSIGSFHEEVFKNILSTFLPSRYSLKTGFIYVEPGILSNQIDVLIIDENESPSYLFKEGDFVVIHPDAVVCGIEIKTKIKSFKAFKESMDNLVKVKSMAKYKTNKQMIGALLFAYEGYKFKRETYSKWYRQLSKIDDTAYPDLLFILNSVMIQFLAKVNLTGRPAGHYYLWSENKENYTRNCLSVFLNAIRKIIELISGKTDGNPFEYASIEDLKFSNTVLITGAGLKNI